jgi:hypothetical protein
MRGSYCYMPILKARGGHFDAVRAVSPIEQRGGADMRYGWQSPTAAYEPQ